MFFFFFVLKGFSFIFYRVGCRYKIIVDFDISFSVDVIEEREKVSAETAAEKLITFQHFQIPLQTVLQEKKSTQPFILATGTCKKDISSYYLVIDDKIIPTHKDNNIITAFDLLFKCHFVFDVQYNEHLKFFFQFIQSYFYKIELEGITSRMREIRTKFENEMCKNN